MKRLKQEIETADAILIGAGAGLSASAGFVYDSQRFKQHFSDFEAKYGFHDMYTGGFYPYGSPEEYWAWWSRHIFVNRYDVGIGTPYVDLLALVKDKEYFVLTTNVDHQFQLAGFDKKRLFYTQGDYGLWQCARACHNRTYDNREAVLRMVTAQKDMKIPTELLPRCPVCGAPMTMNLRCDDTFVQDEGWYEAANRYDGFVRRHKDRRLLLWELGVGYNTPGIIKYPFWQMAAQNPRSVYACINKERAVYPEALKDRSIGICGDAGTILKQIKEG